MEITFFSDFEKFNVLLSDINTCIYRGHSLHESLNHVCDVSFLVKDKQYNRM